MYLIWPFSQFLVIDSPPPPPQLDAVSCRYYPAEI